MAQHEKMHRTSRQGIQALFTFTPFKLQRAQAEVGYSLILAPAANLQCEPMLEWRSQSSKNCFSIPITDKVSKKILHPHEIYPQNFNVDRSKKFIFKAPKLWKDDTWNFAPLYMEYSWNALSSSFYCTLGWVSTSSCPICPLSKECKKFKPNSKGDCTFYRGPQPYTRLYNVYPHIVRKFEDPLLFMFDPILAIRFDKFPLAVVRFTEKGSFIAYIDGITFAPKMSWMQTPRLLLQDGLGFKIEDVNALEFDFIPDILRDFIKEELQSDRHTLAWVILKKELYWDTNGLIKENRGFTAFDKLDEIATEGATGTSIEERKTIRDIINKVKNEEIDEQTIEFAEVLLLHSLAHTIKNGLVASFGCKTGDITYSIEHPKLKTVGVPSPKKRVLIFETAMGGYGYIRKLVESLKSKRNSDDLRDIFTSAYSIFKQNCEIRSQKSLDTLETKLKPFSQKCETYVNPIIASYKNSFPETNLYPHINSIRKALTSTVVITDKDRSMIDDLIGKGPHCWDGCQLCVMMERECNFLPFDQPFLLSEHLLTNALCSLDLSLRNPISFSPLRKGLVKEYNSFLSVTTNSIDIATPWISPEIVNQIIDLHAQKQVKVRILTKEDLQNSTQIESFKLLRYAKQRFEPNFSVRTVDELHAKGVLVDKMMVLHGSFNLTRSGLNSNVENITVDFSCIGSSDFLREFNSLWEKSIVLV